MNQTIILSIFIAYANAFGHLQLLRGWPSGGKIVVRPGVPVLPGPITLATVNPTITTITTTPTTTKTPKPQNPKTPWERFIILNKIWEQFAEVLMKKEEVQSMTN